MFEIKKSSISGLNIFTEKMYNYKCVALKLSFLCTCYKQKMLKLFIHLPQNNAKFIQHLLHYTFFKRETVGRQTELNLQDFKVKRTKKKLYPML